MFYEKLEAYKNNIDELKYFNRVLSLKWKQKKNVY